MQNKSSVLGTPRFMAPEVVRGEAMPSSQTDLYSLAVLLFYMFMVHHPLEGKKETAIKCLDLPAMNRLYGTEPLFIFDPSDSSNAPDPRYHRNALEFWPIYPKFLRDQFTKAFTDGIRDPQNGRVAESKWRSDMIKLRDSIVYCGNCGLENFYDDASHTKGHHASCWSCKKQINLPFRLQIGSNVIALNHDTELFPHHIDHNRLYDFSQPVAAVTQHPTDANIWGIKNLSNEKWSTTTAQGTVNDVEPGRSFTLANGTQVNFGGSNGEIKN
jgi:serine/threonine protein kinase